MSIQSSDSVVWTDSQELDSATTSIAVATVNGATAVFECTADVSFTCTVEACLDQSGANWREVPCLVSDGGAYTRQNAGDTITLSSGDFILVPSVGYSQVRVKRAAGTATVRAYSHPADLTALEMIAVLPEFGVAGSPSADVMSIQGEAGMVPVLVQAKLRVAELTPTIVASSYSANDVLFDRTVVSNAVSAADALGEIIGIQAIDLNDVMACDLDLYFLSDDVTIGTADSAINVSAANAPKLIGKVTINAADWDDVGAAHVGQKLQGDIGLPMPVKPKNGTTNIYVAGVVRGAVTFTEDTNQPMTFRFWLRDAK